jgi:hypothetical protein
MHADTVATLASGSDNITTNGGLRVSYPDVVRSTLANLPPDPDNMNDLRAQWADDALVSFERAHGEEEEFLQNAVSLLCYIGHWCDRNGFELTKVGKMAAERYSDETKGQGSQFSA